MTPTLKACFRAMLTAFINGSLALALMLLVEFAISGTLHMTEPYLWAGLLIWVIIFVAQFLRERHLCRSADS
ncbi:hypothetical protein [Marinobacter xestospongiae]|uniref:Uncharacterized protein n=1 Tax=Marinobacter xestospongiae TaxID=994319 RepID=A0ABU3VU18_9GAMM|nr:hypothetical protein [Marinobacter xestospongiae]MDV2077763.1 hypothetical protein [Marinobacter xestospongiae]